ncbi:hypothetical protein CEXT_689491 [Caerostris extrusa]|uniref:Uncharacterized protein n=1 Tax=Caerostris extrusa TaxID=172846 RepID=A0AAV4RR60_CAEEX|nr:hypothetical protein CEXT_689491 [Caerostris extrusa]
MNCRLRGVLPKRSVICIWRQGYPRESKSEVVHPKQPNIPLLPMYCIVSLRREWSISNNDEINKCRLKETESGEPTVMNEHLKTTEPSQS